MQEKEVIEVESTLSFYIAVGSGIVGGIASGSLGVAALTFLGSACAAFSLELASALGMYSSTKSIKRAETVGHIGMISGAILGAFASYNVCAPSEHVSVSHNAVSNIQTEFALRSLTPNHDNQMASLVTQHGLKLS